MKWALDIFGVNLLNYSVGEIAGVPLISLSETPLLGGPALVNKSMGKTFVALILLLASPIMVLTAIAVKTISRGLILFKLKRHCWDGEILQVFKFRSIMLHAESDGYVT